MNNIPERWTFEEEVYYFRSDPRAVGATVLMTVDESSYNGESSLLSSRRVDFLVSFRLKLLSNLLFNLCRHRRSLDRDLRPRLSPSHRFVLLPPSFVLLLPSCTSAHLLYLLLYQPGIKIQPRPLPPRLPSKLVVPSSLLSDTPTRLGRFVSFLLLLSSPFPQTDSLSCPFLQDPTFLEHVMKGLVWSLEAGTTKAFDSSAEIGTVSNSTSASTSSSLS